MRPSIAHGALCHPRNKSGILGWRSEKTEMVNGYEAKVRGRGVELPGEGYSRLQVGGILLCHSLLLGQVYGASNVELITRTRTEHLSDQHKGKSKGGAGTGWVGRALRRLWSSPPPLPQAVRPPCSPSWASPSSMWGPTMG